MLDNVVSPCGDPKPDHVQASGSVCPHTDAVADHHVRSIYYIRLSLASSLQGETPASLFSALQEDGTIFYLPELNALPVLDEYTIGSSYVFYHILFAVPVHADAHALVDVLSPLGNVQTELLGVIPESSVKTATGYFSQFILSSQGQQVEETVSGLSDLMAPLFAVPATIEPVSPSEHAPSDGPFLSEPNIDLVSPELLSSESESIPESELVKEQTYSCEAVPSIQDNGEKVIEEQDCAVVTPELENKSSHVEFVHTEQGIASEEDASSELLFEDEQVSPSGQTGVVTSFEANHKHFSPCSDSHDDLLDEAPDTETAVVPKYLPPASDRAGQSAKLDTLVSRVSEIAGMQTRLYDYALAQNDDMLRSMADELNHLYGALRDSALDLRMVALEPLLVSLGDWATECAQVLGKTTSFEISCEDTQLDSEVADKILEALAEYFEYALEKESVQSCTQQLSVKITAEYSGADVLLHIEQKGFAHADSTLDTPDALLSLQSAVFALHGAMAVAYSDGQHMVIKINVPITQAMIEGLLVQCGEEQYVVPMNQLAECVDCNPRMGVEAKGNKIVLGGTPVPYLRLREFLGMEVSKVENEQCLVIQSLSGTFGLIVDGVAGELQTAVKPIGPLYSHIEMFTGASVKPDGTLALVLNLQHLQVVADCLIVG